MSIKIHFLLVLCILCSIPVVSQWAWQNPYPRGYLINDIKTCNDQTIWAVGEFGTIIKSSDAGISWEIQSAGTGEMLSKISIIDENNAWVAGENGCLLQTSDGGSSWLELESGTTLNLADVHFKDPDHGWLLGYYHNGWEQASLILHTQDGGLTWDIQLDDASYCLYAMYFIDDQEVIAVGQKNDSLSGKGVEGIVIHSMNGGNTWEEMTEPIFQGCSFSDVFFISSQEGWVIGPGIILHTGDGGSSWEVQFTSGGPGSGGPSLEGVYFTGADHGFVVGSQGFESGWGCLPVIFITSNGGLTWEIFGYDGEYGGIQLSSVCFTDDDEGWIAGSNGTIINSTDGGGSWETISGINTLITLSDVFFTDPSNGWAVGYNSILPSVQILMRTGDGGNTWEDITGIFGCFANAIFFMDQDNGWAVGKSGLDEGAIFHTSDGGITWERQFELLYNNLNDIYFTDLDQGWAVGYGGNFIHPNILHTADGGNTWLPQDAGTEIRLDGVCFPDPDHGWAVGINGTILHTIDGGISWLLQNSGTTMDLKKVDFIDQNNGWIAGRDTDPLSGIILHTGDGGLTWETQLQDTGFVLVSIDFPDASHGWAAGWNAVGKGTVIHTGDGGNAWTEQQTGIERSFSSIFFTDHENGWIVGESGMILHTSNGGMVGVEQPAVGGQRSAVICYPNPTSGIVDFRFSILDSRWVSLRIYDLQGREVATVLDGRCSGDQVIRWDASGLPAGIYFYRLTTDDQRQTTQIGKIVLNH